VIKLARRTLAEFDPHSVHDVRHAGQMLIRFSPEIWRDLKVIRAYLFTHMYRAPAVVEMREHATGIVNDLFPYFLEHPAQLPKQWRKDVAAVRDETGLARLVSDYIAGMTDRFAIEEHARLCGGNALARGR